MLTIGELSKRTGTKVPTIRYYEKVELLPAPERSEGGQRRYDSDALQRLTFIRHARELGFGLDAIRDLLDLTSDPDQSCTTADNLAKQQLELVRQHIERLKSLEAELVKMIKECDNDDVAHCQILKVLGDHDECIADHPRIDKCLDH